MADPKTTSPAKAAATPETKSPTNAEAAQALGIPESEVVAVVESKAGTLVRTTDNQAYVIAASGAVAFFTKPNPKYKGTFPVYAKGREDAVLRSLGAELPQAPSAVGEDEDEEE